MTDTEGVAAFVRRYAKTWVHALATAAMTAFGTLTVVDNRFAALAIAAYVLPPVALYLRDGRDTGTAERAGDDDGTAGDDDTTEPAAWTAATTPTTDPLHDAAVTATGACAVGADGVVLTAGGDGWTVALPDGPAADGRTLRAADAAGDAVWVAGDGGTLGRLDGAAGGHTDHSAPAGDTTNAVAVAAAETDGAETVLVADGGGRVRRGVYRAGAVAWDDPVTPGSGASVAGLALAGERGYLCDTAGAVFETTDGGRSFSRVGIDETGGTPTGVAASEAGPVVADDDGVVHRFDGQTWTPVRLDEAPVAALAGAGDRLLACCPDGAVHERTGDGSWARTVTPASGELRGAAVGRDRAVVVGDGGTVVDRSSGR